MNSDDFGCSMAPAFNGPVMSLAADVPDSFRSSYIYSVPTFRDGRPGCATPAAVYYRVRLGDQPETCPWMYISQRRYPTRHRDPRTSYSPAVRSHHRQGSISKKDTLVIAEQSIAFEGRCMWLRIETRYCPSLFEERVYGVQVRQISVFRLVCIRGRLLLALVQRPRIAVTIFVAIDLFCEQFDTISVRTFILQHTCINHPSVEEPFTASKYYYSPCVFPLS